ncbi:hypothetical protein IRJ41_015511, partial [Triplophysa rosa]
ELGISSLLRVILLWNSVCVSSYTTNKAAHSHAEVNTGKTNPSHVRTIRSVYSHPGQTLELQDDGNEEMVRWWQTPFGLFEGCNLHSKDPVETCNGSLRISKVTTSHDGLYLCVCQDETGRTISPYRVNVLNPNMKERRRKTREAEVYDDSVSDSQFVAAVTSSVIVTFFVAFTLGAFTRSYVMKCVQMTRARMPRKKDQHHNNDPEPNTNNTQPAPFESVHFYINQDSGEDTVDMVGSRAKEHSIQDSERDGDVDGAAHESANDGNDESNQPQSDEEENQEFETVPSPHPKKRTRVIKVYNYDEEGNRYGHMKDSGVEGEDEVRPRVRTKSLTRLNAIMKQAESVDFHPDKESTDSQSAT